MGDVEREVRLLAGMLYAARFGDAGDTDSLSQEDVQECFDESWRVYRALNDCMENLDDD